MSFPKSRQRRARSAAFLIAGTIAATAIFAGCTGLGGPDSSKPSSSADPSGTPNPTASAPTGPVLVADGTATDNLPLFQSVVDTVWASPDNVSGRAYVDALVAAGFDKTAMQVTSDLSTVGNAAESIQFSVRWGEECLVGQVGPSTGTAVAVVLPGLPEGGCLVGTTRAIDW